MRLKKAHPCGGFHWTVNRVGGDVGLRCDTCGHYVMTPRFRIERRIREIVRPAGAEENDAGVGQSAATTGGFDAKAQGRKEQAQEESERSESPAKVEKRILDDGAGGRAQ